MDVIDEQDDDTTTHGDSTGGGKGRHGGRGLQLIREPWPSDHLPLLVEYSLQSLSPPAS